jgi:hypothetical protein
VSTQSNLSEVYILDLHVGGLKQGCQKPHKSVHTDDIMVGESSWSQTHNHYENIDLVGCNKLVYTYISYILGSMYICQRQALRIRDNSQAPTNQREVLIKARVFNPHLQYHQTVRMQVGSFLERPPIP